MKDLSKSITLHLYEGLLIGIGDLHGNYDALDTLLTNLHSMYDIFSNPKSEQLRNDTTLVFTGDYIDRGSQALKIIERLHALQEETPDSVHTLFGNHELMALGDLDLARDAHRRVRNPVELYNIYTQWGMNMGCFHGRNGGDEFIREFGADPEEQFTNYVKRMDAKGDIGEWMRGLKGAFSAQIYGKRVLFTHADVPEEAGNYDKIRDYLTKPDIRFGQKTVELGGSQRKFGGRDVMGSTIFWNRQFSGMGDEEIADLLDELHTDYLVVGHTVEGEIEVYADRVFRIDVGMAIAYGENEPQAIVFKKGGAHAFYARQGKEELLVPF
jgi:hypothetical protein